MATSRLRAPTSWPRSSDRGAAVIELALMVTLLAVIMVGAVDFARVFRMASILTDAARAGAQYGSQNVGKSSDLAGMTATAQAVASANSGFGTIHTVTATRSCFCATDTNPVASAVVCSTICSSSQHLVVSVTVTATNTFTTIAQVPGIPHTVTITRSATMRAQ